MKEVHPLGIDFATRIDENLFVILLSDYCFVFDAFTHSWTNICVLWGLANFTLYFVVEDSNCFFDGFGFPFLFCRNEWLAR